MTSDPGDPEDEGDAHAEVDVRSYQKAVLIQRLSEVGLPTIGRKKELMER